MILRIDHMYKLFQTSDLLDVSPDYLDHKMSLSNDHNYMVFLLCEFDSELLADAAEQIGDHNPYTG